MKPKHTPGLWQAGNYAIDNGPMELAVVIPGYTIASLDQSYYDHALPDSEVEANAHLIAAAPELLEALESMLQFAPITDGPEAPAEYIKALQAIAKARGES